MLTRIEALHAGAGLRPSVAAADASDCALLGYFHNGPKADGSVGVGRNQAIFPYSVSNNMLLNMANPYRAHADLPAGVPLPGMVKVGPLAIGIYQMSREDATASAAGSSVYPISCYGVVPWASIDGWTTMAIARNVGCRLPTWEEWLGCVQFNPGSATPAVMNGNTNSGASSDDATQSGTADPTQAGRTLTGTGPRATNVGETASGRSWYSPAGLADPVGNIWEWVAQFFGGLKPSNPGTGVAWGSNSDYAYNFYGQAYNPNTGGWTDGLPSLLIVGGYWSNGANAGVRAAGAYSSPGDAAAFVGFRLSR
ncbi:MAG: SUMF1/EgtB/PvdO family nonheme iron enzyme [Caldilineaceae bacterium]|nr:SUMF1/EgtB/PvdO family nonheme iron enzyme [Caldilineaceae bacterium]